VRPVHYVCQAFPKLTETFVVEEILGLEAAGEDVIIDSLDPPLDEPRHPRLAQYEHEHTKRWSAQVARADAFVMVTPEYNFSSPPALLNAFDYLLHEWAYKPAGFVSYGGVSGGTRSAQMTKQTMTALKMVPLVEAVHIPFFQKSLVDGEFRGDAAQEKAASTMLDELLRWESALRVLRGK